MDRFGVNKINKIRPLCKYTLIYIFIAFLILLTTACQNGLDNEIAVENEDEKQTNQVTETDDAPIIDSDQTPAAVYEKEPGELEVWIYDSLEAAVLAWIDQRFLENPKRDKYNFYFIETIDDSETVVIVGMCCSEPEYILEYELTEEQWILAQKRAIPHSGYDVIIELGKRRDELLDLFGDPNRIDVIEDLNNNYNIGDYYYFYDHLQTGFFIGGEPAEVQGMELHGYYYCFSIAPGEQPYYLIQQLGEPSSQGYSEQAEREGYPSYVRFYNLFDIENYLVSVGRDVMIDNLVPELEGYLDFHFFSECEGSPIEIILVSYPDE